MTAPGPAANALSIILTELERRRVPYCVLRNYERLPQIIGNDVDILIGEEAVEAFAEIVEKVAREGGWNLRRRGTAPYFILYRLIDGQWAFFRLDVVTALRSGGVVYSKGDDFVRSAVVGPNGFRVPNDTLGLFHELLHTLLGPAYNRRRYVERLASRLQTGRIDWQTMRERLRETLPKPAARYVLGKLREKDLDSLFRRRWLLELSIRARRRCLSAILREPVAKTLSRVRRILGAPGLFVVLVGPDGVGKSTTAQNVAQILRMFHRIVSHHHLGFRPAVLPTRQKLGLPERSVVRNGGHRGTEESPASGPDAMGIPRLLYYTLDYLLGYLVKIRPVLQRHGVALVERYYYDYVIGTRKNPTVLAPDWFVRLLFRLAVPKPDAVVLLYNAPEAIRERRAELTVGQITSQVKQYEALGKRAKHFLRLRTDRPPDVVATELVDWLRGLLDSR